MSERNQTLAQIDEMTDCEGILSIKGHGFGPEAHLALAWDRFGPGIWACKATLEETIAALHDAFLAAREKSHRETEALIADLERERENDDTPAAP